MAMSKGEVQRWLDTLAEGSEVAIDDGGLSLVEVDAEGEETGAYLEVGGVPSSDDEG